MQDYSSVTVQFRYCYVCVIYGDQMTAHFQETTESLSVLHVMCWRKDGTFTTARRCCSVFVILVPDRKLHTYLLAYLLNLVHSW